MHTGLLKLVEVRSDLLRLSVNHVATFRDVKHKGSMN